MINLVLAGGRASGELSPLVPRGSNKVLLRVLGKPILHYPLRGVMSANKREVVLVYREGEERVAEEASRLAEGYVKAVPQPSGESVRDAIAAASAHLEADDSVLLAFGDVIVEEEAYAKVVEAHLEEGADATVLVAPVEPRHVETYGVVAVDEGWRVKKVFKERPDIREPLYTIGGVYVLPTRVLDYIERGLDLPDALDKLSREGVVRAVLWSGLWIDVGYPADVLEAVYQLLGKLSGTSISSKAEVEPSAVIEGPVVVEGGAYIDHMALIKGPAYIGPGAFVGAHSFVRDYVDLEERSRVGAYGEVKFSSVQPYVLMDSRVTILNSVVGENSVLGTGVTTLNVLPSDEAPPRLREHVVRRGSFERKMGAVIGCCARVPPYTVLKPGSIFAGSCS